MEDAATFGRTEGVPENQVQSATHLGGTRGGSRKRERGPQGAAGLPASAGGRGRALTACILRVCRRSPGGAHAEPRRHGPSEPLPHPPVRGPLGPRGARRAGAEGEETPLGK